MSSLPDVERTSPSSYTVPFFSPDISGTSLVPVIVTVTVSVAVPSKETTSKVSVSVTPAGRA